MLALVLMMKYLDRLVDEDGNRIESPNLERLELDAGDETGEDTKPTPSPAGEVAKEIDIQLDSVKGG